MLPFSITLNPGEPVAEQILYAVRKAVVSGQLKAGEKFPSVRQLSQELRINPNTAHKVVAALVNEGVLVTTPAVGSIVAERPPENSSATKQQRAAANLEQLAPEVEWLVVEAMQRGLTLKDLQTAIRTHWHNLSKPSNRSSTTSLPKT